MASAFFRIGQFSQEFWDMITSNDDNTRGLQDMAQSNTICLSLQLKRKAIILVDYFVVELRSACAWSRGPKTKGQSDQGSQGLDSVRELCVQIDELTLH